MRAHRFASRYRQHRQPRHHHQPRARAFLDCSLRRALLVLAMTTAQLLRLRNVPILDALRLEEALFRADARSWLSGQLASTLA